jgi:hypothetical protein
MRGLQLIELQGNEEGMQEQLEGALEPPQGHIGKAHKIASSALTEFQRALQLDFQFRSSIPIAQLCRDLIPDFDHISVKRPLTTEGFPLPIWRKYSRPASNSKIGFLLFEVDAHILSKTIRLYKPSPSHFSNPH